MEHDPKSEMVHAGGRVTWHSLVEKPSNQFRNSPTQVTRSFR